MEGVSFDEPVSTPPVRAGRRIGTLSQLLIHIGLVKTETEAQHALVGLLVLCGVLTILILLFGGVLDGPPSPIIIEAV